MPEARVEVDTLKEIARALASRPECVWVDSAVSRDGGTDLIIHCAKSDRGRMIGKEGIIFENLKAYFRALGTFNGTKRLYLYLQPEESATEAVPDGVVPEENEALEDTALLELMVVALVERKECVKVTETDATDGNGTNLTISVARPDRGRVIGKQGSIIESMKAIFRAIGTFDGTRRVYVHLEQEDVIRSATSAA